MSSFFKGSVFMIGLATVPPAAVSIIYSLQPDWILNLSISTKLISAFVYFYLILYGAVYSFFTHPLRHLPTPASCSWILSQGAVLLARPPGKVQLKWMEETPNDGIILFRGFFHLKENLLLTKPETVMEVLNAHSYDWQKPVPARKFLARILGDGLIVVEGDEHKMQRRNAQPAFSGKAIKELVPLMWSKGLSLADALKRESAETNGEIEVSSLTSRVTLDIIGAAGIGKDFSTTENSEHELAVQYQRITDPNKGNIVLYFIFQMTLPQWLNRLLPFKANARVADATISLRRITKQLLDEKRAKIADEEKAASGKETQKDIIAIMMKGGKFTDQGLTDQLLTFLAAGHETTASALTWTLYLLGKHPQIQTRARTEVRHLTAHLRPEEITADTVDSLLYIEAIANEVLRIYPTVPITARRAVRNTRIGEHFVPKGSFAVICAWALNRSTKLWGEDAAEFKPERWLEETETEANKPNDPADSTELKYIRSLKRRPNGGATSPYAFVTFLHGPRSCIGQSFARYELKCLLAVLLLKFEWTLKRPLEEPVPDGTVTIRPRDGMEICLREVS